MREMVDILLCFHEQKMSFILFTLLPYCTQVLIFWKWCNLGESDKFTSNSCYGMPTSTTNFPKSILHLKCNVKLKQQYPHLEKSNALTLTFAVSLYFPFSGHCEAVDSNIHIQELESEQEKNWTWNACNKLVMTCENFSLKSNSPSQKFRMEYKVLYTAVHLLATSKLQYV